MTEENEAPSQPVSPSGEIETREAGCICIEAHPGSADRAGLWEMVPECPVHGASDHDCAPFTTAPVSSGGQADGVGEGCPTCSGPFRETVGMVCQTCGTDYAPADPGIPLGTVRRASQAFLMAQSDYLGQDLAFMDAPMRAALAAARPVLSREAIRERLDGHWPELSEDREDFEAPSIVCQCGWRYDYVCDGRSRVATWRDHLADVLAGGQR